MKLLILGLGLDPHEVNTFVRIDDICQLVDKFYPQDFEQERIHVRINVDSNPMLIRK